MTAADMAFEHWSVATFGPCSCPLFNGHEHGVDRACPHHGPVYVGAFNRTIALALEVERIRGQAHRARVEVDVLLTYGDGLTGGQRAVLTQTLRRLDAILSDPIEGTTT